eukprot:TRINITY_DN5256_c0_g3_i2.p1 TRINITY_DN5256_c0_g3~~TRINITY_DN5256_c0_g3_i2.p1  ORF type:complete len:106 (+),score=20.31 TRINITY_DN5256_c0_g3_i2:317-634(+)
MTFTEKVPIVCGFNIEVEEKVSSTFSSRRSIISKIWLPIGLGRITSTMSFFNTPSGNLTVREEVVVNAAWMFQRFIMSFACQTHSEFVSALVLYFDRKSSLSDNP